MQGMDTLTWGRYIIFTQLYVIFIAVDTLIAADDIILQAVVYHLTAADILTMRWYFILQGTGYTQKGLVYHLTKE